MKVALTDGARLEDVQKRVHDRYIAESRLLDSVDLRTVLHAQLNPIHERIDVLLTPAMDRAEIRKVVNSWQTRMRWSDFSTRCRDGFVHSGSSRAPRRSPNVVLIAMKGLRPLAAQARTMLWYEVPKSALRTMKSPVVELFLERFKATAAEGATVALKLRVLAGKVSGFEKYAHQKHLEDIEDEIAKHFGMALATISDLSPRKNYVEQG